MVNPEDQKKIGLMRTELMKDFKVHISYAYGWPILYKVPGVPICEEHSLSELVTLGNVIDCVCTRSFSQEVLDQTFYCKLPEDIKEIHIVPQGDEESAAVYANADFDAKSSVKVWEERAEVGWSVLEQVQPQVLVVMKRHRIEEIVDRSRSQETSTKNLKESTPDEGWVSYERVRPQSKYRA